MKYCTVCKAKYEENVSFCPTDGEVLEDDPSSIVGTVLDGQYNIESLLGKGGMGAVYLARHILLGDRVAIKILPPEVRNNADWLRRFRREGQAARRLRHANAVAVHDLRTAADGTIYMVMEYVEGQTLDAELKQRGRFTPAEAVEILEPIMSVLNTAHSMGVVHRDLKPENIMIAKATAGREPSVKLLDLGIAKMREIAGESTGSTELTMAGQVLGTPYYMSPEQWGEISRDGNPEIDGRADIYSLGLVAYQMVSGKRPYSATTLHELRRDHINVSPPPLHGTMPDVSQGFSDAIDRAISKDRGDRQSTAGELAGQLRAAVVAGGEAVENVDRTLPDIPHAQSSYAHTRGAVGGLETKSDVNAPTIITVDSLPTSPPSTGIPPKPHPVSSGSPASPEIAGGDRNIRAPQASAPVSVEDLGSSVTVQQSARTPVDQVAPKKARGKSLMFIGAGAFLVVLAVVGVGGYFASKWMRAKPDNTSTEVSALNGKKAAAGSNNPADPSTASTEVGRYWLEVEDPNKKNSNRAADSVVLEGDQGVKFHFSPKANGYIYIIGPGVDDAPTIFLTAKPSPMSGLRTNETRTGLDFIFPSDSATKANFMRFEDKRGTYEFDFVFSTNPITTPAFFGGASEHQLTPEELKEWAQFRGGSDAMTVATERSKSGGSPFVSVKVPQTAQEGRPVIFKVKIEHD